jgi:hypothetical protein
MGQTNKTSVNMSEDWGRRTICEQLARLAERGCGHFRARWLPQEQRLQLQGEVDNRWETIPGSEFQGQTASCLAAVLETIRTKRNDALEVSVQAKRDLTVYSFRMVSGALRKHPPRLADFFHSKLFWD